MMRVLQGAEGESLRVLVCDDERHIVRLIEVNLTRQGHTVSCAYDGHEAIRWLQREEFDLVVIDRDMPDMSGDEVVLWIRTHEPTRDLRVVMLDKERRPDERGGPPGADLYLTKPFNPMDLFR